MLTPTRPVPRVGSRVRVRHFGGLVEEGTIVAIEEGARRVCVRIAGGAGTDGEEQEFVLSPKNARFVAAGDEHGPRLELLS